METRVTHILPWRCMSLSAFKFYSPEGDMSSPVASATGLKQCGPVSPEGDMSQAFGAESDVAVGLMTNTRLS